MPVPVRCAVRPPGFATFPESDLCLVYLLAGGDTGEAVALVPLQLLWLNLMTDGVLGLAMGTEPAERSVMQRPPQRPGPCSAVPPWPRSSPPW